MALSRRSVLLSYIVGCIIAASLAVYSPIVGETSAYIPRAVIQISSDSEFTPANGVTSGDGTQGNPYMISGWDIVAGWDKAIEILNTDAYFAISDCYLHDSDWYVVYLENANNGTVRGNNVTSNYIGLTAASCENLVVADNLISDTIYYGLDLMGCNGTVVSNNSISGSRFFGMVINDCVGAVLHNNTFVDDGIEMWGDALNECNSHQIDTSNTVNGLPILYYANETDLVIDSVPVGELILANCSNIAVNWLNISGPEVAIFSAFCNNETISNCAVTNAPYALWFWDTDGLVIRNSSISNASNDRMYIVDPGFAIYAYMSDRILIEYNQINNSDFGIFLGQVANVTCRNNAVTFGNYATAVGMYSAANVLVERNNLSSKDSSLGLIDSLNCTVANNTMSDNCNEAFTATNVTDMTIMLNEVADNGFGMRMQEVYNVLVSFNSVTGGGMYTNFGRYGIDITTGSNVTLNNNTVSSIPDGGVKLQGVDDAMLSGNQIGSNLNDGMRLLSCLDMRVLDNWIDSNGNDGLFETGGAGAFEIIGNQIQNNLDSGIETSHAAEIARNSVANNSWYGIGLAGVGSTVYHNNIIGNVVQAFQNDGYVNAWDNGYPDGGNYWSGYAGVDLNNGPAQDLPGSDGIGDTPRSVPVGAQDRYPLMVPFGWNRPPVASFGAAPAAGDISTVFEFNASASWDYETPAGDLMFRWDWDGDGTWDTGWTNDSYATHQFASPGTYTVKLQVRDANSTEAEYSLQVEVADVIPEMPALFMPVIAAALCLVVLVLSAGFRRRDRSGPN